MTYRAPLADILFALTEAARPDGFCGEDVHADLGDGFALGTLTEAARLAENVLAPLNRRGDQEEYVLIEAPVPGASAQR